MSAYYTGLDYSAVVTNTDVKDAFTMLLLTPLTDLPAMQGKQVR